MAEAELVNSDDEFSDLEQLEARAPKRTIVLVTPEQEVTCAKWPDLAQAPICFDLKPGSFVAFTKVGDVFAFRDRNNFEEDCVRKVFVLRAEACVYIFDKDGCPIDEPAENVDNGRQDIHDPDKGFVADWEQGFYKLSQPVQLKPAEAELEVEEREELDGEQSAFDSMLAVNQRIAKAYAEGTGVFWYSGFVAEVDSETGARLVAFDDGDLITFCHEQLEKEERSGMLKPFNRNEGGMVANQTGKPMAERVAYNKVGKPKGNGDAVGVLIGLVTTVAGQTVHEAFIASEPALRAAALRSRAASKRNRDQIDLLSEEERIANWTNDRGFSTFRRKDLVQFMNPRGSPDEPTSEAIVVGVIFGEKQMDMQGRKCLILAERAGDTYAFFPGRFQEWQRCVRTSAGDPRDSEQVRDIDDGEAEKVTAAFLNTNAFDSMNTLEKMYNAAAKGPPSLAVWRELKKKEAPKPPRNNKRNDRSGNLRSGDPPPSTDKGKTDKRSAAQLAADRARERAREKVKADKEKKQREIDAAVAAGVKAAHADHAQQLQALQHNNEQLASQLLKLAPTLAPAAAGPAAATGPAAALPTTLPPTLPPTLPTILPGAAQGAPPTPSPAGGQVHFGDGSSTLPAGWRLIRADQSATGVAYYMNRSLNVVQYHRPAEASPPLPPPPLPASTERHLMSPIPIAIPAAMPATSVQGTSPAQVSQRSSPAEVVSLRIARLRATLAHETNASVRAYLAGELATAEAMQLQPSFLAP